MPERRCTYCRKKAFVFRLYGYGEGQRASRAVPTCGSVQCAFRADRSAHNTGRHYYGHAPLEANPL